MGNGIKLYLESRDWVKTIATVTSLRLSDSYRYDRTYGETAHKYRCYVEYVYTVNNTDYDGNQASIFWRAGDNNLCYRLAQKRGHDEIPCYYNPRNHRRSLLDRTFHEFELCKIALVSAGLFVTGAQLVALVLGFRLVGQTLTAGFCTWCGASLVWGYLQATSKLVFYAVLSLVVGILFLIVATIVTAWLMKISFDVIEEQREQIQQRQETTTYDALEKGERGTTSTRNTVISTFSRDEDENSETSPLLT